MTVQAWLIYTDADRTAAMALNAGQTVGVNPRKIDNPLANNIGEGTLVGKYVNGARLLNDPMYTAFYAFCSTLPIRTIDSEVLFLPEEPA